MTKTITTAPIQALFVARNKTKDYVGFVNIVSSSEGAIGVVLNRTSFYAKVGGQIFNMGVLRCCAIVACMGNAQIYDGFVLNLGEVMAGDALWVGNKTHIVNHALREVLVLSPLSNNNNNNNSTFNQK